MTDALVCPVCRRHLREHTQTTHGNYICPSPEYLQQITSKQASRRKKSPKSNDHQKQTHKQEIEKGRDYIEATGGAFYLASQGHRLRGSAGIPDAVIFMACSRQPLRDCATIIWWEAKTERDLRKDGTYRMREEQAAFAELCEAAGVRHVVGDADALLRYILVWEGRPDRGPGNADD